MVLTIEQTVECITAWRGKPVSFEPIFGGITNRNFKVIVEQKPYFVSIAGNNSKLLGLNLFNRFYNSKVCEKMELSPKIIHFLAAEGVLVSEFFSLPTLTVKSLQNPDVQKRLITALKKLHSGPDFRGKFDMSNLIRYYLKMAKEKNIELPAGYKDCLAKADAIGKALEPYREELVPCHNDLIPENIFDDGQKIYLIDFDYSGQNDLCFELGNLCVEAEFSDLQVRELLRAYFGHDNEELVSRTRLHGLLSDIGWSLWSFIQARISDIDFEFRSYGLNRWKRVVNETESGAIDRWLQSH